MCNHMGGITNICVWQDLFDVDLLVRECGAVAVAVAVVAVSAALQLRASYVA